nr:hypothetical protein [Tanacetum cinerariifolium]
MANVPPNDPNVDASAIVPAPVNPDHTPTQLVGLENGFAPHWIGDNIPNNQNGWIEEEKDSEEEPKDDDDDMEMDDEVEVNDPYMDDGSNNPPPPNSEDEETPPTSPVTPDADGKTEKLMSKRFDTEGRVKNKSKEQDLHFVGLGCDNIEMDRTMRNVMSDFSRLKKTMPPKKSTRGNPPPLLTQDTMNRMIQECTFADFMKCIPITFHGNEGVVGLIRWIEKTEMVFTVATLGIEVVTRKTWAKMKVMMTKEFCPPEEIQRMECELWNLRVKEMDISSYTTRFNELVILCPGMVPMERKKVEAYIHGLSENIKGEVTSSEPATLNKAVRMAHTLMEQKVKAIAEREADNKKRKWENFQGGSSGGGNNNSNRNNNNYNSNHNYNNNRNNNQNQYQNPNQNHQNNQRQVNVVSVKLYIL